MSRKKKEEDNGLIDPIDPVEDEAASIEDAIHPEDKIDDEEDYDGLNDLEYDDEENPLASVYDEENSDLVR